MMKTENKIIKFFIGLFSICFSLMSCSQNKTNTYDIKLQEEVLKFKNEAEKVDYDFNPREIKPEKEKISNSDGTKRNYTDHELNEIISFLPGPNEERKKNDGATIRIVLRYEGMCVRETFNGVYSDKGAEFVLWEDGLFSGVTLTPYKIIYKGHWYYDSNDSEEDCINMEFMLDGKRNLLTSYKTTSFGGEFKYHNSDYYLWIKTNDSFFKITEMLGYYYKPTVGLFFVKLFELNQKTSRFLMFEYLYFKDYWLFQVTSDLRAVKVVDYTVVDWKCIYNKESQMRIEAVRYGLEAKTPFINL